MKKLLWAILGIVGVFLIGYAVNNKESKADFLDPQLVQIAQHFDKRTMKNEKVSSANVAWHLDHMLKVINTISESLIRSDPEAYTSNFNIQQIIVHTTGIIPRGAAQSPKAVLPPDNILIDSLQVQLVAARQNLSEIAGLDKKAFYPHAVFDNLDRDQTRRFLEIHTNHHLKIIADILEE